MNEISDWTGERLITSIFNDTSIEHLHRYAMVLDIAKNKTVLDIACGEGYGSNLLSGYAEKVFGVDIDKKTIKLASDKYKSENLEFKEGCADAIPLPDSSIDVVISFETLEHHDKHDEMMKEIKRILRVGGVLVMSTPEKKYYSDETSFANPFHVKELYYNEFKELINRYFNNAEFYAQKFIKDSLILPAEEALNFTRFSGDFAKIEKEGFDPMYIIAISSDSELKINNKASCFDGQGLHKYEHERILNEMRQQIREDTVSIMKNSWSYRIGNTLLKPFRLFKK